MDTVGLVVNSYERTYREVLSPGFFPHIAFSNSRAFDQVVALINNVDDVADAERRARGLLDRGEITGYHFVEQVLPHALQHSGLSARTLGRRPYLLDYGLVMPHVVNTRWLLGWDAETSLDEPHDWISPSISLMAAHPQVFHAGLNWHTLDDSDPGLAAEAITSVDDFVLNYGFSDQLFLVRRLELRDLQWRTFAPAAIVRHAPHPYTFEYRVESYQRATRRMRATLSAVRYRSRVVPGGVIQRTDPRWLDRAQLRALHSLEHHVINRIPRAAGPRFSK